MWDPETGREVGPRIARRRRLRRSAWRGAPTAQQLAVIVDNNLVRLYDAGGDHAEVGEPIESVDAPDRRRRLLARRQPAGDRELRRRGAAVVDLDPPTRSDRRSRATPDPSPASPTAPTARCWRRPPSGSAGAACGTRRPGSAVGQELVGGRTPFTFSTFDLEHFQGSRPAFAPDGRSIAVPSFDGTIAVWDLEPARWLDAACDLVGRNLTTEEWDQYMGRLSYRSTCP